MVICKMLISRRGWSSFVTLSLFALLASACQGNFPRPEKPVVVPVPSKLSLYLDGPAYERSIILKEEPRDPDFTQEFKKFLTNRGWKITNELVSTLRDTTLNAEKDSVCLVFRTDSYGNASFYPPIFKSQEPNYEFPTLSDLKRFRNAVCPADMEQFVTKAGGTDVLSRYENKLKAEGWSIIKRDISPADLGGELIASKLGRSFQVQVQNLGSAAVTYVMVSEWKTTAHHPSIAEREALMRRRPGYYILEFSERSQLDTVKTALEEKAWTATWYGDKLELSKGSDLLVLAVSKGSDTNTDAHQQLSLLFDPAYQIHKQPPPDSSIEREVKNSTTRRILATLPPYQRVRRPFKSALHSDFNACFEDGHVFKAIHKEEQLADSSLSEDLDPTRVTVKEAGKLSLLGGYILASEPFSNFDQSGFTRSVRPGTYPVFISLAGRPVAAKIVFSKNRVVAWEMALKPEWNAGKMTSEEKYGYGVDGGMGSFVDSKELRKLSSSERAELGKRLMNEVFTGTKYGERVNEYINIPFHKDKSFPNLIAFESGAGDGSYASWWGLDKEGQPVCLVTDFDMLYEVIDVDVTIGDIRATAKNGGYLKHPFLERIGLNIRVVTGPNRDTDLIFQGENYLPSISLVDEKDNELPMSRTSESDNQSRTMFELYKYDKPLPDGLKVRIQASANTGSRH